VANVLSSAYQAIKRKVWNSDTVCDYQNVRPPVGSRSRSCHWVKYLLVGSNHAWKV